LAVSPALTTEAGLFPQAGLYNRAGLYLRSGFAPLDLNPLLAYDAESSMVAPFEQPTLDLDPSNPSSLDIITATRAGVATYTDANGVVQSASADTVRVDHVDGVPMILVEPAATNRFTHSEGVNNYSNLGKANCSYSVDSNPFGGFSASCKITSNTFTSSYVRAVLQFYSVSGESNYFTFRVKKKSGWFLNAQSGNGTSPSSVILDLSGAGYISSSGTTASSYLVKEFNDYYLVGIETLQTGTTTAGLLNLQFYNNSSLANYDLDTVEEFFVTGIQWENNSTVATSYIPTSGSTVTRAADNLVISGSDFTDFFNSGGDGTFYAEAVFRQDNNGDGQSLLYGQSLNYRFLYGWDGVMRAYDGATIASTIPTMFTVGNLTRTAVTFNSSTIGISLDGSSTSSVSHNGNLSSANELNIGNAPNDNLNGHIKRIIYWPYHSDDL